MDEAMEEKLVAAIEEGDFKAALKLFAKGADVNFADYFGHSVWGGFAANADLVDDPERARAQVKKLFELGADPKIRSAGYALVQAAEYGLESAVEELLIGGVDPNFQQQTTQVTALHRAVKANNIAIVRLLLAAGARTDLKDERNKTVMQTAKGEILEALKAAAAPAPAPKRKAAPKPKNPAKLPVPEAVAAFLKGPARAFKAPRCDLPLWKEAPLILLRTSKWGDIEEDLDLDRKDFPTYHPIATVWCSSEFLVVDASKPALPVLMWGHEREKFGKAYKSFDAFVAALSDGPEREGGDDDGEDD